MIVSENVYQDLILENWKFPKNFYIPKNFYKCNEGYNEICGDSIKIYLKKNSVYSQISISFTGDGCSISIAFTSIIVKFLNKFPISRIYEKVLFLRNFLTKSLVVPKSWIPITSFENYPSFDLYVLTKVNKYPDRVKCASLGLCTIQNLFKK